MKGEPAVSVVMGVHNGGPALEATVDSVLNQNDVSLEFIVVDDGSTDGTCEYLARRAAEDPRLRVLKQQQNLGLTKALLRGCAEARGELIARQDCGDRSVVGRFRRQVDLLQQNGEWVAVTCGARFVAPRGETLEEVTFRSDEWHRGMQPMDVHRIKGPPHHGATMFRRCSYQVAGGYRSAFTVAQDIDLWLRLAEVGYLGSDPAIGYEAEVRAGSISSSQRTLQFRMAAYAIACAQARRSSGSDAGIKAPAVSRPNPSIFKGTLSEARLNYFVGSILYRSNPEAAAYYLKEALRKNPMDLRARLKLAMVRR